MSKAERLQRARARIAALGKDDISVAGVLAFGDPRVDARLPGGGLALGRWHEAAGEGLEAETAATTAAFVSLLAAPLATRGAVLWVLRRDDLYAPGLCGLGFPAERLIQVKARNDDAALAALEDALGQSGVAAAIGEAEEIDLTAGRRLQLACERGGATGFVIRRRPFGGRTKAREAALAAASCWRVAPSPSVPEPGDPGLGPPRWRVALERCRSGGSGAWIMEKSHGAHPLRVVAELADHELAATPAWRMAG
ncbi:MAG TPA: protein imuA [Caulobacteraceae bacterium]|nr:protein imuA [Caulobacteraceae bacterium]